MRREAERIARANRTRSASPVIASETISPPRYGPRAEQADREEWEEKIAWLEAEELNRNPFSQWETPGQRIPRRHQAAGEKRAGRRDAAEEVAMDGAAVPPLGEMTEEEYSSWVREGMYRLKHRDEIEAMERRRLERREEDRKRQVEREKRDREEQRRIAKLEKLKSREVENDKSRQRSKWRDAVAAWDGRAEGIGFADVPWPVYSDGLVRVPDLTLDNVKNFLYALAEDADSAHDARRKVLRDAIRLFHPDRFNRVLPRVKQLDRELVMEGVELCSRLINDLLSK